MVNDEVYCWRELFRHHRPSAFMDVDLQVPEGLRRSLLYLIARMIRREMVGILHVRKVLFVGVCDAPLAECVRKVEVQRIGLELLSGKLRNLDMDLVGLKDMQDASTCRVGDSGDASLSSQSNPDFASISVRRDASMV